MPRNFKLADLTTLQREHYEVARTFKGNFTTADFKARYLKKYPDRNPSSVLPSDFSTNNKQLAKDRYPSFLETMGESVYRFTGLATEKSRLPRNPLWSRDELIIATDFYKRHAPKIPGKTSNALIALSDEIRSVASSLGLHGDETFRNPNGVYMKLMELRKYDPEYTGAGLGHGKPRDIEREVWSLPLDVLEKSAKAIREALESIEQGITPREGVTDAEEPEVAEAAEGALVTRLHRYRERDWKIVENKKKQFLQRHGRLYCQACKFDFAERYGERGEGFIECHHTVPVSEMKPGARTNLSELVLLCANCHRMIHAKRPWLTLEGLISVLDAP